ncbi:MAG TPA: hypothetical protein VFA83_17470 [Acidimicrobiales bacterium]|nr:hypothetical protein [Acidimicrobiales bacterium]
MSGGKSGADERLLRAVANNAAWCDAVCRAAGCAPAFDGDVWSTPDPSPRYYPNVITLAPGVEREAARRIGELRGVLPAGWGVKDSFRSLDLSAAGFTVLFEAEWLYRPVSGSDADAGPWKSSGETGDLPAVLLADPDVRFLTSGQGSVVANRGGGVIGLSNATGVGVDRAGLAFASQQWPGLPLVGYASGAELKAMLTLGFEPVGPLRVWVADGQ